jgi:hypothetical protein
MGLVAQWICWMIHTGWNVPSRLQQVTARIMVVIFVLINAVIHPLLLPGSSRMAGLGEKQIEKAGKSLPFASETEARMFILADNPHHLSFVAGVMGHRVNQGDFTPFLARSSGNHTLLYKRKDLYTLDVQSKNGSLTDLDNFLLSKEFAMQPGQIVRVHDVVIEVLEVFNGLPSKAQFRFKVPIDDPSLLWFRWENGTYVAFIPPDVGETVTIEGASSTLG